MGVLYHTKTNTLEPVVNFRKRIKKVRISGVSRMTEPGIYYPNLADKLVEYYKECKNTLLIEFELEYISSTSAKWLTMLLKVLEDLAKKGGFVNISWVFDEDDETIQEVGEILKKQTSIQFDLHPVE